eukprot:TRINITY_DN27717_c0_g1_i1.p1 TRINITY_DN27717_c0_g1~~TRINITY_DN27717_c0_g1_i1.p1  ORF type:complete len:855 (+),score=180.59 TRINITY_DN27717_c0_g1_i1:370-2565(+)
MAAGIGACFFAGCIIGGILCGRVSDQYGRLPTFFTFATISSIVLFMSTTAPNIYMYCVLMVFHGISVGGYYTPCYVYASESVPTKHVGTTGSMVSLAYSVMVVVAVLLAYPKELHNWRHFSWLVSTINLSCLAFYPVMVESPRWVMNRHGTESEAFLDLMMYVARANGMVLDPLVNAHAERVAFSRRDIVCAAANAAMVTSGPTSSCNAATSSRGERLGYSPSGAATGLREHMPSSLSPKISAASTLNSARMRVKSVNCLFAIPPAKMIEDAGGEDDGDDPTLERRRSLRDISESKGAGFQELFRDYKAVTLNVNFLWFSTSLGYFGLSYSTGQIGGDLYLNGVIMGLVELPAAFASGLCLNSPLGRRKTMLVLCSVSGGCCLVTPFLGGGVSTMFAFAGKFSVSVAYYVACVWVSELFPTHLRGLAAGLAGSSAFLAGLVSPFLLEYAEAKLAIPLFGAAVIVAGLCSIFLPDTTPPSDAQVQHGEIAPVNEDLQLGERVFSGIFRRAQSTSSFAQARRVNALASSASLSGKSEVWMARLARSSGSGEIPKTDSIRHTYSASNLSCFSHIPRFRSLDVSSTVHADGKLRGTVPHLEDSRSGVTSLDGSHRERSAGMVGKRVSVVVPGQPPCFTSPVSQGLGDTAGGGRVPPPLDRQNLQCLTAETEDPLSTKTAPMSTQHGQPVIQPFPPAMAGDASTDLLQGIEGSGQELMPPQLELEGNVYSDSPGLV